MSLLLREVSNLAEDEDNIVKKGSGSAGIAAAAIALAAVAGAAGAVLSNKELRNTLGKKTTQALEVVTKLAQRAEEEAVSGLRYLRAKSGTGRNLKKGVKKTGKRTKRAAKS